MDQHILLSHHAYYLIGSDSLRDELFSILEHTHKIPRQGNADFFDRSYQSFTIDDAREVKTIHGMRPVTSAGKKIFVLQMNAITTEAQNALLKLLEEPAVYAHFFIIIPSVHLLLPTVKSRMRFIGESTEKKSGSMSIETEVYSFAKKIVTLAKAKRLEEVKKLIDDISKEKKTKQDAIDLLNTLQAVIYVDKGPVKGKFALETIERARTYIHDRAPSVKMLLEYVMLGI